MESVSWRELGSRTGGRANEVSHLVDASWSHEHGNIVPCLRWSNPSNMASFASNKLSLPQSVAHPYN